MLSPDLLEHRLRILLPETYEVFDKEVQPRSMGSAGLKFGPDGKVLWGEMWASFCDLAMAGGPPHRGRLLQPERGPLNAEAAARMDAASAEIARGIGLVTGLVAEPAPVAGWLRMYCTGAAMAGWLARSTNMENVSAVAQGLALWLPTGPEFRVEKEIKNVITSVAKGCHYWQDHMAEVKHDAIAELVAAMDREAPLLQPALRVAGARELAERIGKAVVAETDFAVAEQTYPDWLGLECNAVPEAVWVMRALVASNVVARREETVVFLPVNPAVDADGARTLATVRQVDALARTAQVLSPG